MELKGKAALVTGGAVGTGRAVALQLAERGCHVAINFSRSKAEANEAVRLAERFGVRAVAVRADVSREADVRAMVTRTIDDFGQLDVLDLVTADLVTGQVLVVDGGMTLPS